MPQSRFSVLLDQYNLPASLIYLAPVLPIVQVMWADGRNQIPERAKLHVIIENHCQQLSNLAGGVEVLTNADIELFDWAFIASKPDEDKLQAFMEVASELLSEKSDLTLEKEETLYNGSRIFHACLEIAATCPVNIGKGHSDIFSQRIMDEERRLIEKTYELFLSRHSKQGMP